MTESSFPDHYDLPAQIHAGCICFRGHGILLRGPTGAGKSDLAIQLIERGAQLVADDLVLVSKSGKTVTACAPASGRGLIELRGQGIYQWPHIESAVLTMVVDLLAPEAIPRLPQQGAITFGSHSLRKAQLPRHAASNTARIMVMLEGQALSPTAATSGHG